MVIATLRRTVTGALRACARLGRAVSVFLFFNRQWFPVRRRLRTDYAVFDARDARVGRPGLTALVPKSFHIARPTVIVQQNEHPVSRCLDLVNYRLEKEGPFDPGEMILSGSIP